MDAAEAITNEEELITHSEQYLTFKLAGETYGVEILRVQGIQGWVKVTKIPNTPEYMLGVINLRGAIVPIINIRHRFGLEIIPFDSNTVMVVVKIINNKKEHVVGLVVDAVSDVCRIDNNNIQTSTKYSKSIKTEYIKGLTTVNDEMVVLLELDNLFSFNLITDIAANEGHEPIKNKDA